jgi:hypothetical protein
MDHCADDLAALRVAKGFPQGMGMPATQADTIDADLLDFVKS